MPPLIPENELDLFHYMADHIGEEVIIADKEARIVFVNKAAARGLGYTKKDILSRRLTNFFSGKVSVKQWHSIYFLPVQKKKKPVSFTINRVVKGGQIRTVQITVVYMLYKSKHYVVSVGRDISEKQEMEMLIRESEKMEAFQNFIAGTIQEIQQPLKGLLDHSKGLIDRYKDRNFEYIGYKEFQDIMKTLQTMNDQVKYCFNTTDRLNSLNRKKARLERNHCNANHIIHEAVNMLKHPLEVSDIHLKLKLNSKLPHVAISSLDLNQALNNIITNAVQSLPDGGGKIQIKTIYQKAENKVRIDCQDDGVGIPQDVLTRVFDPFFTTKPRGLEKNSGLGLYIVHSIMKSNKGEVFVKSHYRSGTLVTIVLPVFKPKKKREGR